MASVMEAIEEKNMDVEFLECKIECILKGAYMTVKAAGAPGDVIDRLKEIDPDAKFRDSFPVYGRGGRGGKRDTKTAKIVTITIKAINGGKFIDLVCQGDAGEVTIAVSKKRVDDFIAGARDRLDDGNKGKLDQAQTTILLMKDEQQIPVKYFEIDGKCFFDSFDGDGDGN